MPRRDIPLVAGEYYHIYNRGNNRQNIFFEEENYMFFLRRLREHLVQPSEPCATLVAYSLMPNHYHLLLQPHDDDLSHHLQLFSISYTKAINKRYGRVGALFQGQFQAKRIDRNEYLVHLSRYIHLNPVQAGLVKRPEDWAFSSYREYVGLRQGKLPKPDIVLAQFAPVQTSEVCKTSEVLYREFVAAYLPADKKCIAHLMLDDD
jgi:putative transposase